MPRMRVQNNVQEKDKEMYPFTKSHECVWGGVSWGKASKVNNMENLSNCARILQSQKSIQ